MDAYLQGIAFTSIPFIFLGFYLLWLEAREEREERERKVFKKIKKREKKRLKELAAAKV